MQFSKQLMERFFSGDCTEKEKESVREYLKNNPEMLAQYLTERGWDNFHPEIWPEEVPTSRIREAIEKQVGVAPVSRMAGRWMIAAGIVSVVCLASFFYWYAGGNNKKNQGPEIRALASASPRKIRTDKPQPAMRCIVNALSKAATYSLPDGSRVILAGRSSVSFYKPFINGRRDIFLSVDAVFTVKKDPARPFAVHSRGIVTTALGTVFRVNDSNRVFTKVRLISGRVVIRKEVADVHPAFSDIYLKPGQELVLNNEAFSVKIKSDEPRTVAVEEKASMQPQVLQFNRQSLAEIFTILNKNYHTRISYHAAGMKNIDFTGSFDKDKETLDSFLNTLCILNELELEKTDSNSFSIKEK